MAIRILDRTYTRNMQSPPLVPSKNVKIVIFAPQDRADDVREAIGKAGAGRIEMYDFCSFTSSGFGAWRPLEGSQPAVGQHGIISTVPEVRIETTCLAGRARDVLDAAKKVHPYEAIGYDIYPLYDLVEK